MVCGVTNIAGQTEGFYLRFFDIYDKKEKMIYILFDFIIS